MKPKLLNKVVGLMCMLFMFANINSMYAQYCTASGETGWDTSITLVQFNTINNPTAKPAGYNDYTGISTTVIQSSSYNLTVNLNTDGDWEVASFVWIDWNQDEDFDDVGEWYDLGIADNVTDGPTSLSSLSITVPAGATLGTTRMRVSAQWDVGPGSCDDLVDGEFEDYSIVVNAPVPAPEINILGNAVTIVDGDTTPLVADDTDFGNVDITASTNVNTFTIQNTGTLDLNLTGGTPYIVVSGTNAADFTVTATPTTPIAASGNTTFDITFDPSAIGLRTATLTIANDDTDENPYNFDIQGTGFTPEPEINLLGNAATIVDGDVTPSTSDDTAHGIISVGSSSAKTYTIQNTGTADLTISSIILSNTTDFSITGTPYASPVTAAGNTTFEVTFNALTEGTKTTTVTVTNNDSDEGSYQFDITATAEDNAATLTNFTAGAAVIDMGIQPQTVNNGLRPYGLIQDLVSVHEIPVFWIINDSKSFVSGAAKVDQTDLNITGTVDSNPASTPITTDLKSGPFLIPSEYMPQAQAVIESWIATSTGAGTDKLTVYWNLEAITNAPVHGIISYFPNVTLYPVGGDPLSLADTDMETAFYTPAGITTGFTKKAPDELGSCDLIYVLSHHTDPDTDWSQNDIDTFYDFVMAGGNAWLGCHDVSLTENVLTTSAGNQLNFLSNGGLLPYKDLINISTNYSWLLDFADGGDDILEHDNTFNNADILYDINTAPNPLMQFMGENHPAMNGNSEHIYVPLADAGGSQGGWRSTTTVSAYDPNNSHIPTRTPGRAGTIVYGPAYGNTDYGTILYSASHISSGNNVADFDPEHIGELRLFGNFLLESALEVTPEITIPELPYAVLECGDQTLSVNATVDNIPFTNNTYQWSYQVISGTSTGPVTFTPDNAGSTTIYFPLNTGEVVFKIILTFTSTPDGGCTNPITSKYISYVTVNESTTADAGPDQIIASAYCGTEAVQLAATNTSGYSGTWTVESGTGGSFSNINNKDAVFYGTAGQTYTLKWDITCAEDEVTITLPSDCENINFDGSNDFINFEDNYDFSGSFTSEIWVKPSSISGTQIIYSKRDNDNQTNGYDLRLTNATLSFNWNTSQSITSPYNLTTNRWYHIAISFDGSTYRLYIDGVEVNSENGALPIANNLDFIIGGMDQTTNPPFNPPVNYYNGWLDEMRFWNKELTVAQIRNMMNQEIESNGSAVRGVKVPLDISNLDWDTDLIGYFQMKQSTDISGGYLMDNTINNINGKLRNITTPQDETTPLPYTTKADGSWNDTTASTPWTYGDSVWDAPNSLSIDGSTIIDWNIVETNHNITIDTYAGLGRERTLLGLIVSSNELQVNGDTAAGTGNGLTITDYLKIDGSLDLEGESQLIQSTGSILDVSSSGTLERDQQGTADLFTYNYWAAPVGISNISTNNNSYTLPDVMNDGTTPITVPSAPQKSVDFLTSGYNGSTGDPISIADYWVWKFNNQLSDSYASWQHVRSTGSLNAGEGFTMKGIADTGGAINNEQNYVFSGKPNNGDINLTVSSGNDYLIGNPYASALDANEFILDNISDGAGRAASNIINGTLYFWEHFASSTHNLREYQGGYGTYTLMGGTAAISNDSRINSEGNLVSTKGAPQQYIPVSQGFFVTADTGGLVSFKNNQRLFKTEATDPSVFMRNKTGKSESLSKIANEEIVDTRPKIRIMLDSPKGYHRQLLLGADENASTNFDKGYDALLIEDNKEDIFWTFDGKKCVIQATNNFNDHNVFPLGIVINQEGMATIKIDELENIPDSIDIFIYDKDLNIFHDLNFYPYNINLPIGEHLNKFEIVLYNKSLTLEENTISNVGIHYSNEIKSIIINNPKFFNITKIKMFNLLGQEVFSTEENSSNNYYEIKTKQFSSGTYVLSVITDKGTAIKKVVVE